MLALTISLLPLPLQVRSPKRKKPVAPKPVAHSTLGKAPAGGGAKPANAVDEAKAKQAAANKKLVQQMGGVNGFAPKNGNQANKRTVTKV